MTRVCGVIRRVISSTSVEPEYTHTPLGHSLPLELFQTRFQTLDLDSGVSWYCLQLTLRIKKLKGQRLMLDRIPRLKPREAEPSP